MSRLPSCYACKYYNMQERTCKEYPNGIPKDVVVEIIKCDEYCVKEYEDEDDYKDVPIVRRIPGTPFCEVIEN